MRIRVEQVKVAEYLPVIEELARRNWLETGLDFDLQIDAQRLVTLEETGMLLSIAAFDGEKVIGYSTAYVTSHTFNPTAVCCFSEALFVAPEYRRSSAAHKLITATERVAKGKGAQRIFWNTRAGTRLAAAFERRGYEPADVVVWKGL